MGGYGSGRHGSLPTIEDGLRLDLRRLLQQGLFIPDGSMRWTTLRWTNTSTGEKVASCGLSHCAGDDEKWLRLQYRHTPYGSEESTQVDDRFRLERFPQPFGGHRWYFICPATGHRCQVLYKPCGATYFRSRTAFRVRLQYHSQKQDWRSRLLETSRRVSGKVLRAGPPEWRDKHKDWDIPPKPPRMRWTTYNRHFAKWEEAERLSDALLTQWMSKLGGL